MTDTKAEGTVKGTTKGDGFSPFADETAARTIGGLSIENGTARIALHGTLDITRDEAGLAQARRLRETVEAIVRVLEAADLPEKVAEAPDEPTRTVRNPFG
jgi:hypothetical protein